MTIRVTTLDNGLTVMTDSMDTVESVALGCWVEAGARNERAEINGVSHLLEHMAFKGTERRSAIAISEEIEAVGGQLNAYTSRDATAYYAKVLKEDTGLALDIIADIIQHPVFDPEELKREQAVVVQEIHQAVDTPDDIIFDRFQEAAYPHQAVGRPVLGTVESVRALTRETLGGYMRGHYTAPRMVLSAAGAVDHDRLVEAAASAFTALPRAEPSPLEAARYVGGETLEARDLEQVHLLLGFDGVSYTDPHFYAASVFSTLLGGGMSSRLFQEIRERRGLAYSVYSFTSSYHDGGLFGVYAGTGEDEAAELLPVLCDELLGARGPIGGEELARARAQLKAGLVMSLESPSARCESLARQMMVYGRPVPVSEMTARIAEVDEAMVRAVAERILSSPPTFAAIGPLSRVEDFTRIQERLGRTG